MKKNEVPQEKSFLKGYTRDVYYAKNNDGNYETILSTGWNVKHEALECTWDEIKQRTSYILQEIKNGEKSPLAYYMELKLMNVSLLSSYTGFWKCSIRKHLKPNQFRKLPQGKLQKYAQAFNITVEELTNFNPAQHEGI
jgi:hypothetical protein